MSIGLILIGSADVYLFFEFDRININVEHMLICVLVFRITRELKSTLESQIDRPDDESAAGEFDDDQVLHNLNSQLQMALQVCLIFMLNKLHLASSLVTENTVFM